MRRELILKTVQEKPGISYNEIVRHTDLSNGVVTHYLIQLMDTKKIEKYGKSRPKYFLTNVEQKDKETITILRNNTNLMIIKLLLKSKSPLLADEISKTIKKSSSTVSVILKKLQKNNMVKREILNRKTKLTSDIGYIISDKEFLREIFSRYNIQ
tara:strand:- start:133 stop:597 length:465 start_codon:yes stop_codon:yes gene_type:complete